jgi:YVTN family beta-propeller protein
MVPSLVIRYRSVLNRLILLLSVLSAATTLRAQISVPTTGGGLSLAVNPITNKIYVPSRGLLGAVNVIDGVTNTTKVVTAGTNPSWAAVNPVTNKIYVTDQPAGTVIVIDGTSDAVTTTLPVGVSPSAVAVNPLTNKIYVVNNGGASVTVIDGATNAEENLSVGTNPYAVAINPVTNKIYIANSASSTVSVIDGATNDIATVTVGSGPVGVAVNPVTNKIYVIRSDGNMTVIRGADNTVETSTVNVGSVPSMVAVNPVTNKIYVINFAGSPSNILTVIDGATDSVTNSLTMGGIFPYTLAVNPVTNKVYVANFTFTGGSNPNDGSVTVVDGATNTTTTVPAVGNGSNTLVVAVNPVTNRVYTSIPGSVTAIDGAINASTSTSPVSTGNSPQTVVVNPVTNKIYAPNADSNTVTVIDVATNSATATVNVGSQPVLAAVDPVTNRIYITNFADGTVSVIDSANDSVINTLTVGPHPQAVAADPVTKKVYVANPFVSLSPVTPGNTVSVIDETTETVTATVTVGSSPSGVAVNAATSKVYVPNNADNTVSVINEATNSVTSTVAVGTGPSGIAVNPVTNRIYVANTTFNNASTPGTVSVIDGTTDSVIATPTAGIFPRLIVINQETNKIYVSNSNSGRPFPQGGSVTVLDGATNNPTQIDTSTFGSFPWGIAVNPITTNVYVSNFNSRNMMVIDGASNTVTSTLPILGTPLATNCSNAANGSCPQDVLLYPAVNRIYTNLSPSPSNPGSAAVIDVDGHQTVPLTTTIAGVTDALTISTANVFQTANRAPSFTVNVNSTFSDTNPLATNPPPTAVYYQVDGGTRLSADAKTNGSGANPGSFNITVGLQQIGLHTLYVYATYGNEGGNNSNANGNGNSPEIGNLTAYLFLVVPVSTATTLTTDVNPQVQGQPVVFTAQVAPSAPTGDPGPTGTVTFYEGATVLGSGSIDSNGFATFTTSSLSLGDHSTTAAYSGDEDYGASTSSPLTVTIVNSLTPTIELVSGNDQAVVYGNAFAQPLTVVVMQTDGTPMAGATVTFAGANLSFSPSGTVTTNSSGQASVIATGTHIGDLLAIATTVGVSSAVNFALTVTPAQLTVTANNFSRTFGAANPAFTGTITGAVRGDTFTFSASTIATASSPVGTYPIIPSATGPTLADYTVHIVNGTLTVNKAILTVTANDAKRLVGLLNPLLTTTMTGFVNGDTSAALSGMVAISTTATQASPAGAYPITVTQGSLSATNYGFNFVNGTLLVEVVLLMPPQGPSPVDTPVTLTATVPVGATGTVTFYAGTVAIGTVTIPTNVIGATTGIPVTLETTSLDSGTHTITAVFSGDANFPPSTSPPISVVVTPPPPDFAVATITGRQLIPPGASATYTIVVSSVNGPFTSPVTMSASNLPAGATYTFNPPAATPGAGGANTGFTVSIPKQSNVVASRGNNALGMAALALLLLPLACLKRYRGRPPRLLLGMLLALASFVAMSGCGQGGYFSQTEQTYTITVTGTSGTLVRSTTISLTVE